MPAINLELISPILLAQYRIPAITAYNRLESSPRTANFDRSMKAEIRDPLWMLTRQWQFGEFQGEDAGSPVIAEILGEHTLMDRVAFPTGKVFTYDEKIPLETKVERENLPQNLFIAVQIGRYYVKLLQNAAGLKALLINRYPLNYAVDPNDYEGLQLKHATFSKIPDGLALILDITTAGISSPSIFEDWIAAEITLSNADKEELKKQAGKLLEWYRRTFSLPEGKDDSAWLPSQLEYQFDASSAPGINKTQTTLRADQYAEGHLDWYSFDLDRRKSILFPEENPEASDTKENYVSFIPAPIAFKGMPHPRFWSFEDSQTDFGKIDTSATGLLHLLLAEFGLIYSNDWFMLPYPMEMNTLCEIKGLAITDVFGVHSYIRPAGRGQESNWQRWAMFHHSDRQNSNNLTNTFYLPPNLSDTLEGDPLEKVNFLRDEMANMVWAVENRVHSQSGKGMSGKELAFKPAPEVISPLPESKVKYVLGTTVPDNWIPFMPVHMEASNTEVRLQRARMPAAKGPQGQLLTEVPAPYFINEEEVPRSGVIVQRKFQRARWIGGKSYLWIGRDKRAGNGEGWSNLNFDQIVEVRP